MPDTATCDGCLAPIRWVITVAGRRMPLDPDPQPDGNVVPVDVEGRMLARVLTGDELPAQEPAWVPHHRTCPKAADYRHPKTPKGPRCESCYLPMDPQLARVEQWREHPACDTPAAAELVRHAARTAHPETT
jgi:hypothetical protein